MTGLRCNEAHQLTRGGADTEGSSSSPRVDLDEKLRLGGAQEGGWPAGSCFKGVEPQALIDAVMDAGGRATRSSSRA